MAARALDLTGQKFGRLTAICNTGRRQLRNFIWKFRCDCGVEIERPYGEVRRGNVQSCGCLQREGAAQRLKAVTHLGTASVTTHGMTGTPTFISWDSMKQRCLNHRHKSFPQYGGRGIKVCDRWLESFENFMADMGERPDGMTLERDDVDGDYEPSNCHWATAKEQGNNRRNNRMLSHAGETMTVKEWADRIGISDKALLYRINNGWSTEEALTRELDHGNGWVRGVRKSSD